ALDTASPSPAVTVLLGSHAFDEMLPSDGRASERLLTAIESCFGAAGVPLSECARIAVCAGPGSFTGVRVGLATAWGLGRALGRPVEAVSTLEAMAEAARAPGRARVAAALDAGRGEVIWQAFDLSKTRATALAPPARARREDAAAAWGGLPCVTLPVDLLGSTAASPVLPSPLSSALASAVARAPSDRPAATLQAVYSRPSAAEEKRGAP
ncbi:MAG TPA: tRNA (adenosine(37)-N6)-threonylcarbamoyltransferase complex dimerization subunit type 1 TsaB, partial [Thermoanaerobaculia bacterium]|nr:tRNA (adenosine(37)-N6)-threonylcarbamoyltransferase complex dimerization subunit type 1 TsaB [Thermoanaerobaculia bacterium]